MLITPRTYKLSQIPDKDERELDLRLATVPTGPGARIQHRTDSASSSGYLSSWADSPSAWGCSPREQRRAVEMLLVHQVGSVKVGEVVRSVPCFYASESLHRVSFCFTDSMAAVIDILSHTHLPQTGSSLRHQHCT